VSGYVIDRVHLIFDGKDGAHIDRMAETSDWTAKSAAAAAAAAPLPTPQTEAELVDAKEEQEVQKELQQWHEERRQETRHKSRRQGGRKRQFEGDISQNDNFIIHRMKYSHGRSGTKRHKTSNADWREVSTFAIERDDDEESELAPHALAERSFLESVRCSRNWQAHQLYSKAVSTAIHTKYALVKMWTTRLLVSQERLDVDAALQLDINAFIQRRTQQLLEKKPKCVMKKARAATKDSSPLPETTPTDIQSAISTIYKEVEEKFGVADVYQAAQTRPTTMAEGALIHLWHVIDLTWQVIYERTMDMGELSKEAFEKARRESLCIDQLNVDGLVYTYERHVLVVIYLSSTGILAAAKNRAVASIADEKTKQLMAWILAPLPELATVLPPIQYIHLFHITAKTQRELATVCKNTLVDRHNACVAKGYLPAWRDELVQSSREQPG
jgi:hypothetical protein